MIQTRPQKRGGDRPARSLPVASGFFKPKRRDNRHSGRREAAIRNPETQGLPILLVSGFARYASAPE
jgi:hypothetical protein